MLFTRRQLLLGGLAATPIAMGWNDHPLPAELLPIAERDGIRQLTYFSPDFAQVWALGMPNVFGVNAIGLPSITLKTEFDTRLVVQGEGPSVAGSGFYQEFSDVKESAHGEELTNEFELLLTQTRRLAAPLVAGTALIARPLYPNDGLADVDAIKVALQDAKGSGPESTYAPSLIASDGLAWGATLSAIWGKLPLSGDHHYRLPVEIRCRSVGPGPIPEGATVTVRVDPVVVSSLVVDKTTMPPGSVFGDRYSEAGGSDSAGLVCRITLLKSIDAGELATFRLLSSPVAETPEVASRGATVRFAVPDGSGLWQRTTGKETLTDLTSSGVPRTATAGIGPMGGQ